MESEWKQIIFDPVFTADIRNVCSNDTPAGSVPGDFELAEHPEYGVLMYSSEKEAQALDILFIAVGRAWCKAKREAMDNRKGDNMTEIRTAKGNTAFQHRDD